MAEPRKGWLDKQNLLALQKLAAVTMFIIASIVGIQLIARNNPISEGVTIFAGVVFGMIMAFAGINGWERIKQRGSEWEPSQEAKDTIQLNRHLDPNKPIISPATMEHPTPTVLAPVSQIPPAPPKPAATPTTGPSFGGSSQ